MEGEPAGQPEDAASAVLKEQAPASPSNSIMRFHPSVYEKVCTLSSVNDLSPGNAGRKGTGGEHGGRSGRFAPASVTHYMKETPNPCMLAF
jgi:hypothetical protein